MQRSCRQSPKRARILSEVVATGASGAPTEGDTESGAAILAAKRQCRSFRAFTEGLPDPDDENLATEMTVRYEAIEVFLSASVQ